MGDRIGEIDLLEPWIAVRVEPQRYEAELRREMPDSHPLYGKVVRTLAERRDCDDVLFEVEGGRQYAVVHLTYSKHRETDPFWPRTELYSSLDEWVTHRMLEDHRDWTC